MSKSLKHIVLISGLLLSGFTLAESASENLTRIEAETLVLKAREKQLDVQAKIIAKQSEIASKQADSNRVTQSAVPGLPVILSIEGLGKNIFATLQLDNGSTLDVQPGEILSNKMKIISIRQNEVIIENAKKERVRLAPASQTTTTFDVSYPSAGLRLPPLAPPSAPKGSLK
jgi:type IV pilus biogenesis protein PilP